MEVYEITYSRDEYNCPVENPVFLKKHWFSWLVLHADEYYLDKQSQNKLVGRVRIHRDTEIGPHHRIRINGKWYQVGRVAHGVNKKGIPVTDISYERVESGDSSRIG